MLTLDEVRAVFTEKLSETGSLDAALLKACWVAYNQGLADKEKENANQHTENK